MGIVIDGFSHILPIRFANELHQAYPTDESRELTGLTYFSDMENRVRTLDKYKIDKQVLTLARPNIWMNMPREIVLKLTCVANDALAEAAKQFPDRFISVGTLPMLSGEFMSEFDRCVEELGMAGIQVFSNMGGRYLDDPEFETFFAKANRTRTPIWIHPQVWDGWSQEFALDKILGWPFDTSWALCRLVFSGMMENYSDLRIITHHMGGMIPYFCERIRGCYKGKEMFPRAGFVDLPRDPTEYFRRFYGDTVLNGAVHAFECGYKFFGPGQIIFATDYPFGPEKGEYWIKVSLHQMTASELPEGEKNQMMGGNLVRLLENG